LFALDKGVIDVLEMNITYMLRIEDCSLLDCHLRNTFVKRDIPLQIQVTKYMEEKLEARDRMIDKLKLKNGNLKAAVAAAEGEVRGFLLLVGGAKVCRFLNLRITTWRKRILFLPMK
jgi:hypothetical protein